MWFLTCNGVERLVCSRIRLRRMHRNTVYMMNAYLEPEVWRFMEKTNPMRILDKAGVDYSVHDYTATGAVSGPDVAASLGENPEEVFKTLVVQGKSEKYYVLVVPVSREADLKKAAAAVGEKSVHMIPSKDLQSVTGYIHGGCSPLGMKRKFRTVVDITAAEHERFYVSAGRIGLQLELKFSDFSKVIDFSLEDITP